MQLIKPLSNDEVVDFAGVRFRQTTTAPSVTISSNTYYNTYIFADDAIFSVFLGPNPEAGSKNYKLMIQEAPAQGSVSDPARQIGGWCSYNVNNLALSKSSLIDSNPETATRRKAA
jgi:hypothetical protein